MIRNAGEMREPVRFERRADRLDPVGQIARVWELVAQRWAKIEPIRTLRPETETAAGQDQSIVRFWITAGGFFSCLAEDRIVHEADGRVFGVSQVQGLDGATPENAREVRILAFVADQMEEAKL